MARTLRPHEAQVKQLTKGSLSRGIFALALPSIGSHVFILSMDIIDGIFLGRLGSSYLAAVTMGWAIIFFLTTLGAGLGIGTVALISRAYGEGKFRQAERIGGQAIYLGLVVALILGVIGIWLSPAFLRGLGADGDTLAIANGYIRVMFGGLSMLFFMFIGGAIFQGAGNTMTPMWITAFALILNMILDPLLIFGYLGFPRLEATGAALATVISRSIGGAIMVYILVRGKSGARITFASMKPDLKIAWRIFAIGFPGAIQLLIRSAAGLIMTKLAAMIGPIVIAVLGTGGRIFGLFLFPGFGFGGAAATIVGQNLGAGKPERAERGALLAAFYYLILLIVCGIPVFIFAPQLARVFNTEPEFVRLCTEFFHWLAVGALALSGGLVLSRALQGAGETIRPMIMTGIALFGTQVPIAYILSITYDIGARGLWIGNFVGGFVNMGLICWVFFRGKWKHKRVEG